MTSAVGPSDAIRILDDDLRSLVEKEARASELPLALARFAEVSGRCQPTQAMVLATGRLLAEYSKLSSGPASLPISVERLCRLCNAELVGARPTVSSNSAYSVHNRTARLGHTGKTYFEKSRISIRIPPQVDYATARVSCAHEIGHILVHQRGNSFDEATVRLPSTPEEECVAEYGARLLLMPSNMWLQTPVGTSLAADVVARSRVARVTIHAAVTRLGDPDLDDTGVRGAILWRLNPEVPSYKAVHERLTPQWHLCRGAYVPIKRSRARAGSLIADVAQRSAVAAESRVEDVRIGTFVGLFRVDVFAWGSVADGTRLVLAIFRGAE